MEELRTDPIAGPADALSKPDTKWTGIKAIYENHMIGHHGDSLSTNWSSVLGQVQEVHAKAHPTTPKRAIIDGCPGASCSGRTSPHGDKKRSPGKSSEHRELPAQKALDEFAQRFRASGSVRRALKADMDRFAKVGVSVLGSVVGVCLF
jgi:hypothetical protein